MKRFIEERKGLFLIIRTLFLVGILSFSFINCDNDVTEDVENALSVPSITVYNQYGETLDIYMDGTFQFTLKNEESAKIDDVSLENHYLQANKTGTELAIAGADINVIERTDYTWTIDDPPDINVTNMYGEALKIYMDGVYQFDLVHEENRWLIDVPFGERSLRADKASDGAEVASITIDVNENKDYGWIIE